MNPDNEPLAVGDLVVILDSCCEQEHTNKVTSVIKIDTLANGGYSRWQCNLCGKEYYDPVIYEVGIKATIHGKTGYIGRFRCQLRKINPPPVTIDTEKKEELHA